MSRNANLRMIEEDVRHRVLVVDDMPENIDLLCSILEDDYTVVVATSAVKALEICTGPNSPDIVVMDVIMPDLDGFTACKRLKENPATSDIPLIFITALSNNEDQSRGLELGASDYIYKPFNPGLVKTRIRNQLMQKQYAAKLEREVANRTSELLVMKQVTMQAMGTLAEYRDPETGAHILRTQNYVRVLAIHLSRAPKYHSVLTDDFINMLFQSAPLHDIGKIGIRDNILLKPGSLTDDEFTEMKTHTVLGRDAILKASTGLGDNSFLRIAAEIAASHHEKWDGSGYPLGLKADEIPISGRLMALADVYDALISKRVYKPAFSHEKAKSIILEGKGTHFDPEVVDAFVAKEHEFIKIASQYKDE
ncbi:MAG: response regulator [Gammaproteobacteria bacterium]|nr:response regulator [Gammaproteobacteria bacterium]